MAGDAGGREVGRISIRVVPNLKRFRETLKSELESIEASSKLEIPVDLDTKGLREKVRAATAGLDEKINVKLDVDKSAFDKLRQGFGGKNNNFGGSNFGGLGSFADSAAIVAAVAALAAPALALLSGALVSLPALLSAVLVPIGAVALGLDGIKKAAEVLKEPLDGLKASLSATFQDRLTPVFQKLAGVMPALKDPLNGVANGLSDIAESFVDTITSGPGLDRIKGTINNIATTMSTLAPGVSSFTNGLLGLAEGVSAKFPAVATWFDKAGTSFSNWVDKVTKDGSLDRAMGNLGDTLKPILDLGGDLLSKGFEFLQDPKFAQSMKDFVGDVRDLVNNVLPGLKTFFVDLAGALDGVNNTINKIKQVEDNLPSWLKSENPTPEQNKKSEGTNPFTSPNAPWRGFWDDAKQSLDPGEIFKPFTSENAPWRTLIPDLKNFLKSDNPFGVVGDWFANTVGVGLPQAAADTGLQAGSQLGQSLGKGLDTQAAQLQTLGPQVQAQVAAALAPIQQIPTQITAAFSSLGGVVAGAMGPVIASVVGGAQQVNAAFGAALAQLPSTASTAFSQVAVAAQGGINQMVAVIQAGTQQAVGLVRAMGQQIVAALQQAASGARAAGAQVGAGMAQGIRESTAGAVAAATAMANAVRDASRSALGIHSPSTVFHDIGVNTMEGLENGLTDEAQSVIDKAKSISEQLTQAINSGTIDPALPDQLKQSLSELEIVRKGLKLGVDHTDDKSKKKALRDQMSQVQTIKDQLGYQKDQLKLSDQYGDSVTKNNDQLKSMIDDVFSKPVDLAKTVGQSALSDLGVQGGAIQDVGGMLMDWGMQQAKRAVSIHVNSVDEALAAQRNIVNKDALQFTRR